MRTLLVLTAAFGWTAGLATADEAQPAEGQEPNPAGAFCVEQGGRYLVQEVAGSEVEAEAYFNEHGPKTDG